MQKEECATHGLLYMQCAFIRLPTCNRKSCTTAACIRDHETRKAFPDGIAWLGLSQQPDVELLQKRLNFQLCNDSKMQETGATEGATILEQQHQFLQKQATGKTILVVLDDCVSIVNRCTQQLRVDPVFAHWLHSGMRSTFGSSK